MTKQTITALFDSREYANNAVLQLRQSGIPEADLTLSPEASATDHADASARPAKGFWASLEDMFAGSDDHDTYAEGLRRGGIMLIAHVDDTMVDDTIRILEKHGSVDLDEREATWRKNGWTGGAAVTGGGVGAADAGPLRSMSATTETEERAVPTMVRPTARSGAAQQAASATRSGDDDDLQVVEERLDVGKRAVNRGKVRIHSYVVETPVSESINLRDETVSVDRRAVDRPVGVNEIGGDAFKDRTIEMEEVDEEAVVGKTARVVEEIGIRKTATDRVQTVNDTVRSTKVEVDDGRTASAPMGLVGGAAMAIADDMEVVGSDGQHVGVVDHVDGGMIKLKKSDPAAGGTHHLIPTDWVGTVDGKIVLKTTASDAKSRWTAA